MGTHSKYSAVMLHLSDLLLLEFLMNTLSYLLRSPNNLNFFQFPLKVQVVGSQLSFHLSAAIKSVENAFNGVPSISSWYSVGEASVTELLQLIVKKDILTAQQSFSSLEVTN